MTLFYTQGCVTEYSHVFSLRTRLKQTLRVFVIRYPQFKLNDITRF